MKILKVCNDKKKRKELKKIVKNSKIKKNIHIDSNINFYSCIFSAILGIFVFAFILTLFWILIFGGK